MPISYSVDTERLVILSKWEGVVTAEDLTAHCTSLFSDDRVRTIGRSLADMRGAIVGFSGEDMRRVTSDIVIPALRNRGWVTAVVAAEPAQHFVTRQFQAQVEDLGVSAIFADEAAALEWLFAQ